MLLTRNNPTVFAQFLKGFFFFLSFALFSLKGISQPVASPDVKCISVAANGEVTLTWSIPPDAGGNFVNYTIYYSTTSASGPFLVAGTITTYAQSVFTHVGINATIQKIYYKVTTRYKPSGTESAATDTLATLFLSLVNPGNGTALLAWNEIFMDKKPTNGWYRVYRKIAGGGWALRDSTKKLTYTDLIDFCGDSVHYKIEFLDYNGCTSFSNISSGTFSDQTPPILAAIDTVSVNTNGLAVIKWFPSPSADADSVVVYGSASSAGPWKVVLTVPVPQTSAVNPASIANTAIEYYRVAFKDSCGNLSAMGGIHKTIFLSVRYDVCENKANLTWNKYMNMNAAVTAYEIRRSDNGAAFKLIASTGASDTNYVDTKIAFGNSYCYVVTAYNGSKRSSSNKVCISAGVAAPPAYHYNRFATVVSSKQIDIKAHVDANAKSVKYYTLVRATKGSTNFTTIATIPQTSSTVLSHSDVGVATATNSYVYMIHAMDSCNHVITSSNRDTTILLFGDIGSQLTIRLSWNPYGRWLGNVNRYDIYRAVDGVWNTSPIGSTSTTTYVDDISPYINSLGKFSYKVVAMEGGGNSFGFADSSASNKITVNYYAKIDAPNAFTPNNDNLNTIFVPVLAFVDPLSYSLTIFDRTGTPIFTSNDPTVGWDGKKNNHPCQEGVYMYLIQCKSSTGEDAQQVGTLSLIR
jgi:gliding motility-associated-like protein